MSNAVTLAYVIVLLGSAHVFLATRVLLASAVSDKKIIM